MFECVAGAQVSKHFVTGVNIKKDDILKMTYCGRFLRYGIQGNGICEIGRKPPFLITRLSPFLRMLRFSVSAGE